MANLWEAPLRCVTENRVIGMAKQANDPELSWGQSTARAPRPPRASRHRDAPPLEMG